MPFCLLLLTMFSTHPHQPTPLPKHLWKKIFEKLRTNYSYCLDQLATQTTILREELAGPTLTGRARESSSDRQKRISSLAVKRSSIAQMNDGALGWPLAFNAGILSVTNGEEAGCAFYGTHPDNVDETRTLHRRFMWNASMLSILPHINPNESLKSQERFSSQSRRFVHAIFFDNAQRIVIYTRFSRRTRMTLNAHWNHGPDTKILIANPFPTPLGGSILSIKCKSLPLALQRVFRKRSNEVEAARNCLTEPKDVKALPEYSIAHSRSIGVTKWSKSTDVANWATLDK
ncbi:MAG: hypothetical protein ACHQ1H_02745 [Nitrososphaerales archaeon]